MIKIKKSKLIKAIRTATGSMGLWSPELEERLIVDVLTESEYKKENHEQEKSV